MPATHTAPTALTHAAPARLRLVHQGRLHRGASEPVHYSTRCPTCGHRAQLSVTYADQANGHPPTPGIVRFRCTNQMALTHQSPSNAELIALL